MFVATIENGDLLKKVIDSVKDLVADANWDCSNEGIALQAMDSAHVSLVSVKLLKEGFNQDDFRCDNQMSMGISLGSMAKVLKCAGAKDSVTLEADEEGDTVNFTFTAPSGGRVSDFSIKLMDIDSEHLGIPEQDYECVVKMSASEFQRICRDMATLGDTLTFGITKEGAQFSTSGDIGTGSIKINEQTAMDESDEEEEDDKKGKKGKKKAVKESPISIQCNDPCSQTFALRYLNFFTKATALSGEVKLSMSPEVPLVVEYNMGDNVGHVKFFLAPKIDDEEEGEN